MLTLVNPEQRVPANHPIRLINNWPRVALKELSLLFAQMYSEVGRPSMPPDRFLKASLLVAQDGSTPHKQSNRSATRSKFRARNTRSLELRATCSLARLQQGKRDEARAMLAEIYNWFTEAFTAHLIHAKACSTN